MKYEIKEEHFPIVICHLNKGESVVCDNNAISWMDPVMETKTSSSYILKIFGKIFSSKAVFQNHYIAKDNGAIAFASSFPSNIKTIEITPDKNIIVQKSLFLAGSGDINASIFFNKKFSSNLINDEDFIMTRISGNGIVFLEIDGSAIEYDLLPGQQIIIDTKYLVMIDSSCTIETQNIIKNIFLKDDDFFYTTITGPGKIILQTMPISNVTSHLIPFLPRNN